MILYFHNSDLEVIFLAVMNKIYPLNAQYFFFFLQMLNFHLFNKKLEKGILSSYDGKPIKVTVFGFNNGGPLPIGTHNIRLLIYNPGANYNFG
jgi:hypothetical protein